jgi:hypothetical protein
LVLTINVTGAFHAESPQGQDWISYNLKVIVLAQMIAKCLGPFNVIADTAP